MSHDIHQKIAKLLRLARGHGATPHEAAAAAGRAQALTERHRLTIADLEIGDGAMEAREPLWRGARVAWLSRLGAGVAQLNDCCLLADASPRHARFCLAGRSDDIRAVRALFAYLRAEIERLARKSFQTREFTFWRMSTGKNARVWGNNFRLGAVAEVCRRMRAARLAAREAFTTDHDDPARAARALVHAEARRDAVQRWVAERYKRDSYLLPSPFDLDARRAGATAGATIDLHDAKRLT